MSLAEVDTGAELNSLQVRVYFKTSGPSSVRFDQAELSETYQLGTGAGCASPGLVTTDATGDTTVRQFTPTTNYGTATTATVRTQNASNNRRSLFYFPMPSVPSECSVAVATLRVYASATASARTMEAWQVSSSWSETAVTWNTQPTTTGSAATTSNGAGYESWTVTAIVQSIIAANNYGFLLKDQTEDSGTSYTQTYQTTEALLNNPQLDITFG